MGTFENTAPEHTRLLVCVALSTAIELGLHYISVRFGTSYQRGQGEPTYKLTARPSATRCELVDLSVIVLQRAGS